MFKVRIQTKTKLFYILAKEYQVKEDSNPISNFDLNPNIDQIYFESFFKPLTSIKLLSAIWHYNDFLSILEKEIVTLKITHNNSLLIVDNCLLLGSSFIVTCDNFGSSDLFFRVISNINHRPTPSDLSSYIPRLASNIFKETLTASNLKYKPSCSYNLKEGF